MKSILIVSPVYPYPRRCGFTVRLADMLGNLFDILQIHLVVAGKRPACLQDAGRFRSLTFCPMPLDSGLIVRTVCLLYIKYASPYFDSRAYLPASAMSAIGRICKENRIDAAMAHTPILAKCLEAVPETAVKIIDAHDIWNHKYLEMEKLGQGRLLYHFRNIDREINAYKRAGMTLAISTADRDFLLSRGVHPLYVPVSFKDNPLMKKSPAAADVLYAAGSGYANIDAIGFFIEEVMPIVKGEIPDIRFMISNPGYEIRRRYYGRGDVVFLPYQEDIRNTYSKADLVVVPLRYGSGLKVKVLESMSFGMPTIISSSASEGIELDGFAQERILDIPDILAREVIRALRMQNYREALASTGLAIIRERYNPGKVYAELRRCLA